MAGSNKSFPNVPWMSLGFGKTFSSSGIIAENLGGKMIRVKAVADSAIRLASQPASSVSLTAGETDYFFIPEDDSIFLISGSINVMY